MRRSILLAIGLYCLAATPAWADGAAAPVITPIQAGAVLDDLWIQREAAVVDRDRSTLQSVEEGPTLDYDLAWLNGMRAERPAGSGKRGLVGQSLVVPQQFAYPAFFVALASVTQHADPTGPYDYWTDVLVVVRDGPSSPWRIRLESWAPGTPEADQLQQAFSTDQGEQFAAQASLPTPQQAIVTELSHRNRFLAWTYNPQPVQPQDWFAVSMPGGGTLACFARSYVDQENRPWWNPVKASAGDKRGIPAGAYATLTSTFEDQQCGLVDQSENVPAVTRVSEIAGYIAYRTTPATPPPWLPIGLAGCLVCAVVFASVWRLRAPPGPDSKREPEVIRISQTERHTALLSTLRVLLGALILVEVERWIFPGDPLFGVILVVIFVVPVLLRVIPARRTVRCSARILIKKPPDEVYAFIRDLRNEPKWDPMMLSVEPLPWSSSGRLYRSRQRLLGDAVLEYETEAEEQPEQRVLKYRVLEKWFPDRAEWRVTPVPDGAVVTITRWFELGPMRAMAYGLQRFRNGLRQMTIRDLNELRRILDDQPSPKTEPEISIGSLNWQYRLLKRIPGIGQSDLGISIGSFLIFWLLYGRLLGDWFATGIMVMLLVHEMGHYVEGHRLGFKPRLPVFIFGGAFVYLPGTRIEPLNNARVSLAGGLAGGAATAIVLCVCALAGSSQLLAWAEAGAGANLFGSLLPFITIDVESILAVVGKWLPLLGIFAAACSWAVATALGVGDFVIPLIVLLAFVVLRLRFPFRSLYDRETLSTKVRLVVAASWLILVAYLSAVFVLTAGWLN